MIGITIKALMEKEINKVEIARAPNREKLWFGARATGHDWKAVLKLEYFSTDILSQEKSTSRLSVP